MTMAVAISAAASATGGSTEFFVYLDEHADLSGASLVAALEQHGAEHRSFCVTNAVLARGNLAAVEAVAKLDEVQYVYEVATGRLERPVPAEPPGGTQGAELAATVFESIAIVNADDACCSSFQAGLKTSVSLTTSSQPSAPRV
jgi:hypothetical protein